MQIAIMSMYGECQRLDLCDAVFAEIKGRRNTLVWNARLNAHGRSQTDTAHLVVLYEEMLAEAVPDKNTFVVLFSNLSHSAHSEIAKEIWDGISRHHIKYDRDVMAAFVDSMARSGCLDEAQRVIVEYEEQRNESKHLKETVNDQQT